MNKAESLALYKKGVEAWNRWANNRLAEKAVLEKRQQWQIDPSGEETNPATKDWLAASSVDFSQHHFEAPANFTDFIFPSYAEFNGTEFHDQASFERTTFSGDAWFKHATFSGGTGFIHTTFNDAVGFTGATFSNLTRFVRVTFSGAVEFGNTTFRNNTYFTQALFDGYTSFEATRFEKNADFTEIKGQGYCSFQKAKFYCVPDFNHAHFTEAPQFDNADFSQALNQKQSEHKDLLSSRWRALKRLAIQGHDHERELIFFAEEIKSQRGIRDQAWPNLFNYFHHKPIWQGGARYWLGHFYEWFSDFGRSVMRPLFWLIIFAILFGCFYLGLSIEDKPTLQHNEPVTHTAAQ